MTTRPPQMRRFRVPLPLVAPVLALTVLAGCSAGPQAAPPAPVASVPAQASRPGATPPAIAAPLAGRAPANRYAVGTRSLRLANGSDRPLPTTVYYPAADEGGTGVPAADGRFPVILFSHGLNGLPAGYQALLTRWAAAGFVVAAPAYPHTSLGVAKFDILDVVNQPADASAVLTAVLALDRTAGDPLRGRLDTAHLAAAGHSAGGITTVGLFTAKRDARLVAGVVLAGSALGVGDVYSGPPASLLFVHGGRDDLVSYASGKAAYDRVPWTKALFTLPEDGHAAPYLRSADPAFVAVASVTTDFLRLALYGDPAARTRLTSNRTGPGTLDNRL